MEKDINVFLALLRAGLWEQEVKIKQFKEVDFDRVHQLAQQQSVVGLIAAGLEFVTDVKIPKETALSIAGDALQIEQRNIAMNAFVARLFHRINAEGIRTVLIKGQGIAQCYERPLWRSSGDVDLLYDTENYKRALDVLSHLGHLEEEENTYTLHKGIFIDEWEVELHGSLRGELWKNLDRSLDDVQHSVFTRDKVRIWRNGGEEVELPDPDCDVVIVFCHILQHFFKGGIGLRQVCDWCRFLWAFKDKIDIELLRYRLSSLGVESEWKAFAALSVNYLGIPRNAIPFYEDKKKWDRKANRILRFIIETGNMGHNRDKSYRREPCAPIRKIKTFYFITLDSIQHYFIFPADSIKVWWTAMMIGLKQIIK